MSTFLGFACDAEALALVLDKDLDRIFIYTEAEHGRVGQGKDMEWEHVPSGYPSAMQWKCPRRGQKKPQSPP